MTAALTSDSLMENNMSADSELDEAACERLSALVDGELESHAVPQACAHWRRSEALRGSWHAYQLIGDVLRSDDLASDPARDAEFLQALRRRLGAEPVPQAPTALDASSPDAGADTDADLHPERVATATATASGSGSGSGSVLNFRPARRRTWRASSAVAAGFIVVGAGVLLLTRGWGGAADLSLSEPMALALPADGLGRGSEAAVGSVAQTLAGGELLRDARLDRYLAAHKQFAGTSALGVPSAYLRSATVNGTDR